MKINPISFKSVYKSSELTNWSPANQDKLKLTDYAASAYMNNDIFLDSTKEGNLKVEVRKFNKNYFLYDYPVYQDYLARNVNIDDYIQIATYYEQIKNSLENKKEEILSDVITDIDHKTDKEIANRVEEIIKAFNDVFLSDEIN